MIEIPEGFGLGVVFRRPVITRVHEYLYVWTPKGVMGWECIPTDRAYISSIRAGLIRRGGYPSSLSAETGGNYIARAYLRTALECDDVFMLFGNTLSWCNCCGLVAGLPGEEACVNDLPLDIRTPEEAMKALQDKPEFLACLCKDCSRYIRRYRPQIVPQTYAEFQELEWTPELRWPLSDRDLGLAARMRNLYMIRAHSGRTSPEDFRMFQTLCLKTTKTQSKFLARRAILRRIRRRPITVAEYEYFSTLLGASTIREALDGCRAGHL